MENCIADFNGAIIGENMVAVIREKSKEEMEVERECTIFIKGVNPPLSLSSMETVINEYASVKSIFPLFTNGAFKGSVCVIFNTPEEANMIETILDGATIDGVQIEIGHFDTSFKEKQKRNCFVTGIPLAWSQEEFYEYCTHFGEVESCTLRELKEGKNSKDQSGCVSFVDYNVAKTVVEMEEGDECVSVMSCCE